MPKYTKKRLKDKYGWTGAKYADLMTEIIAAQHDRISSQVAKLSQENYKGAAKRIKNKEQRFIVPDVENVVKDKGLMIRKAADRGKLMAKNLKEELSIALRDTMQNFTQETGELAYTKRRGKNAGVINPKLINEFENKITDIFHNYTTKHPKYQMPANIHTIAVTEFRAVANTTKREYMDRFKEDNPDYQLFKMWRHNAMLSKKPRKHHKKANGMQVPYDKDFVLENGARLFMPHDPKADAEEVIGCNCDFFVVVRKIPLKPI